MRKSFARHFEITVLLAALAAGGCSFAPENVEVSVDVPAEATTNQQFVMTTTIRNTSNDEQKLLSIDMPDKVLQGMLIERTDPPFIDRRHNDGLNSLSYKFDMKLRAGDQQSIKIHARAVQAGNYSGEISFVVNKDWSALGYPIKMVVLAAPESQPAANKDSSTN